MDYIPVVSIFKNIIDVAIKCFLNITNKSINNSNRYYTYLQNKSFGRCVALIFLPVAGNIFIFFRDLKSKQPDVKKTLSPQTTKTDKQTVTSSSTEPAKKTEEIVTPPTSATKPESATTPESATKPTPVESQPPSKPEEPKPIVGDNGLSAGNNNNNGGVNLKKSLPAFANNNIDDGY